jgi:hypothetical protein
VTTTTLTLSASIVFDGGSVHLDIEDANLDQLTDQEHLLLDVLTMAFALADRIDHPVDDAPQRVTDLTGTADRAPVVTAAPIADVDRGTLRDPSAPKNPAKPRKATASAKPGKATGPKSGPNAKGSIAAPGTTMRAILDTLADHGGRWEGTSQTLATAAGSTPASGAKLIRTLADAGLCTIERSGPRTVTAVALTGAGWRHLDRTPGTGPLHAIVTTEPDPVPADDVAHPVDLATLPRERKTGVDHDAARAAAASAL